MELSSSLWPVLQANAVVNCVFLFVDAAQFLDHGRHGYLVCAGLFISDTYAIGFFVVLLVVTLEFVVILVVRFSFIVFLTLSLFYMCFLP